MTTPRLPAALGLLALAAALAGCARKTPDPAPPKAQVVTVTGPVVRTVTDYEDFTGRTEPYKIVELRSRVTGYLETVHFKDGDDVVAGEPLFDIDRRTYKAEYDKAVAALRKAEKHYKTMELNLERARKGIGVTSKADLDLAEGASNEAEADIAAAAATLELAETNLNFCRISAPFAGRLSLRRADPGNLVKADETPLTTLVALDPIYVAFDVDERTVLRLRDLIRKGEIRSSRETTRFVQIGLASDEDLFPLSGQIVFRDNQIDAGTGTLRIRALLRNPEIERQPRYMLSPGQFVRVRLPVGNPREATLVPERALGSDQGQRFVFVVNDRNEVERRNVRPGPQYGTLRVVEDGVLKSTDRVIVEGLLRVRPGAKVDPRPAEASRLPPDPAPALAPRPEPAPMPRPKISD